MTLSQFILNLLEKGQVLLEGKLRDFSKTELEEAAKVLKVYYDHDKIEMPYQAPDFEPGSALWGATYLYHTMQLSLLRDENEETVREYLTASTASKTPSVIYSADLMLRYLPQLLNISKGLAPDDVLVKCLMETAVQWPFSSIGIVLTETPNLDPILENQSLRIAYIDRIIQSKNQKNIYNEKVTKLINEALGDHQSTFWPELTK